MTINGEFSFASNAKGCGRTTIKLSGGFKLANAGTGLFFDPSSADGRKENPGLTGKSDWTGHYGAHTLCNGNPVTDEGPLGVRTGAFGWAKKKLKQKTAAAILAWPAYYTQKGPYTETGYLTLSDRMDKAEEYLIRLDEEWLGADKTFNNRFAYNWQFNKQEASIDDISDFQNVKFAKENESPFYTGETPKIHESAPETKRGDLSIWRLTLNELFKMWGDVKHVRTEIDELSKYICNYEGQRSLDFDGMLSCFQTYSKNDASEGLEVWKQKERNFREKLERDTFKINMEKPVSGWGSKTNSVDMLTQATAGKHPLNSHIHKFLLESSARAATYSTMGNKMAGNIFWARLTFPDLTIMQLICAANEVDPGFDGPYDDAVTCQEYFRTYLVPAWNIEDISGVSSVIGISLGGLVEDMMTIGASNVYAEVQFGSGGGGAGCIPDGTRPIDPSESNKAGASSAQKSQAKAAWAAYTTKLETCEKRYKFAKENGAEVLLKGFDSPPEDDEAYDIQMCKRVKYVDGLDVDHVLNRDPVDLGKGTACKWLTTNEARVDKVASSAKRMCNIYVGFTPIIPAWIPFNSNIPEMKMAIGCSRNYPWGSKTSSKTAKKSSSKTRRTAEATASTERERIRRESALAYLPPIVQAWGFDSLSEALSVINFGDDMKALSDLIKDGLELFLPENLATALIVTTSDLNPVTDIAAIPPLEALRGLPAVFTIPQGISAIAVLTLPDDCGDDLVCTFVQSTFGQDASLTLALSLGLEPSVRAYMGIGGIQLEAYSNCDGAEAGVPSNVALDMVAMYIEAGLPADLTAGLEVQLSFELGDRSLLSAEEECADPGSMIEPLTFTAILEAGVYSGVPMVAGQFAMVGTLYQLFGLEMLHIADLGVAVGFTPPSPIPSKFEAAGTLAIGLECYTKSDAGVVTAITDEDRACLTATVAFGYSPVKTENYFMASMYGLNVGNLIKVFTPSAQADAMLRVLPECIIDSGFVGETFVSFSPSPSGAVTVVGTRVDPGFRLKGTFNLLGYEVSADINVVPLRSIKINATMDPITFGPSSNPWFTLSAGESDFLTGCGGVLANLTSDDRFDAISVNGSAPAAFEVPLKKEGPNVYIYAGLGGDPSDADSATEGTPGLLTSGLASMTPAV